MKILPTLKSLVKRYKLVFSPKIPTLCEDIMAWSPASKYFVIKLHDAFIVKPDIPVNSSAHEIVSCRFLVNHDLGFPAQFMVCLPQASVLSNHGLVMLKQGAYLTEGNWRVSNVLGELYMNKNRLKKSKNEYLPGDWYSIRSYWSHSYHHWFWDDLTRLLTASDSSKKQKRLEFDS